MEPEQKEKLKQQFEEQRAAEIVKRKLAMKEYWNTLKPFVNAHDVPTLPRVGKQEWEEFYVPKLIQAGAIKREDLIDGVWYYGDYRNSTFGKWDATKQEFGLWRHKFGYYWDTCNHFQDDSGYALFVPLRTATEEEIKSQNDIEEEKNKK